MNINGISSFPSLNNDPYSNFNTSGSSGTPTKEQITEKFNEIFNGISPNGEPITYDQFSQFPETKMSNMSGGFPSMNGFSSGSLGNYGNIDNTDQKQEAFKRLDTNGDERLSKEELREGLEQIRNKVANTNTNETTGFSSSNAGIQEMLSNLDINNSGSSQSFLDVNNLFNS